ncbi:hypothetical protein EK21DRAFT_114577 [Setomelanomma holmii]|uniref:Uncharacterized protein n=1 Tax=Setomelanomma holmii TaxID=210430 RepID=A0A9P4H633_9PLEO|nr:hypothetical protein EK21DRAFT_114577 [Setomelanomma holmii]
MEKGCSICEQAIHDCLKNCPYFPVSKSCIKDCKNLVRRQEGCQKGCEKEFDGFSSAGS